MAEAAGAAVPAHLHGGLPDEIVVWEILIRLPPKSLLRCRAVCPAWRRATSTRDFLLAHHARQPSLPLLCDYDFDYDGGTGISLDVIPFDHRAGLDAVDQLQPVTRLGKFFFGLVASCDGLLILCGRYRNEDHSICNPATHQYARLDDLDGFDIFGIYPHSPTGEYRLLLGKWSYPPDNQDGYYVCTLGSDQPPRRCADGEDMIYDLSHVLFRGSLHWHVEQHEGASNMIKVFSTTTESFRQMRAPAVPRKATNLIDLDGVLGMSSFKVVLGKAYLFEMDGMLGMSSFNDAATTIDIWMTQDYESEAWAIKYRVELPVAELTVKFGNFSGKWNVVLSREGEIFVLLEFREWLLQIDMDSKLVASFHRALRCTDQLRLKQSLVPHSFFPTLEGYVVNDSPFI